MDEPWMPPEERQRHEAVLIATIASKADELEALLAEVTKKRVYEDLVYRFYHQSYKVYALQESTRTVVDALQSLAPQLPLNRWFTQIVAEGTGKQFEMEHNDSWLEVTRPILEAFFHSRYFLEMVCKYARAFDEPPAVMPGGWAAVLYLYNIR